MPTKLNITKNFSKKILDCWFLFPNSGRYKKCKVLLILKKDINKVLKKVFYCYCIILINLDFNENLQLYYFKIH